MTRARLGLTLMCRDLPRHPVLSGISDSAFLIRRAGSEAPDTSGCRSHHETLDLSRIDISWAGRLGEGMLPSRRSGRFASATTSA